MSLIFRWLTAGCLALSLAAQAADFRKLDPVRSPPLALKDSNGNSHDIAAYRGKLVLVNFWASWCPPCREEMPSMQRLKKRMEGRPFVMLGVASAESAAEFAPFLQQVKVDFAILPDPDGAVTKDWKVFVLPTSFLVDAEGRVRYSLAGPAEWDDKETLLVIEGLLP